MNKSKVVLAVCVAGISFLAAMNSEIDSVSANAVMNSNDISQTSNIIISSEKISPYVIEFVTQQESNNILHMHVSYNLRRKKISVLSSLTLHKQNFMMKMGIWLIKILL
ncbi:TPA: hypothetical protein ACINWZ_000047 [Streptococcus agalactiae]